MNPVSGSAADSQSAEYLPDIFKNGSGHPEDINPVASLAERRKRRGRLQVVIGTASVAVLGLVVAGLFFSAGQQFASPSRAER
ncbi:hypothetical protein [Arthrobacter russicus]|uniref:Uncharacterized protein n=1 Tax=Arthrobacter russicus TaxID=172040 RepID=A0ABU1JEK7_9MICC|nr:hypothetical protein [Arthrobacter russicus]MDR6270874.1 hypothetical protein [Arthrobacter russicus]